MKRWRHNGCGTVYKGKTPPLECPVCLPTPSKEAGWTYVGPGIMEYADKQAWGKRKKKSPWPSEKKRLAKIKRLIARDGPGCQGCGVVFENLLEYTLDHIRPKSKGGSNALWNLQLMCGPCNRDKGDRWDE